MGHSFSLAGSWQFQVDPHGTITVETFQPDREITVPLPWQAAFPDLESYSGYAWYRRSVEVDPTWLDGELLLRFGAVDYWCQVFINGQLAGEHEGGYTPFTIAARQYMQAGQNEISVRVYDPAQAEITIQRWPQQALSRRSDTAPPFDANDVPHGKQEWYLNVGGIWQDVTLTAVPCTWINNVQATPNIETGRVHLKVELGGDAPAAHGTLYVRVQDGEEPVGATVSLVPGQTVYEAVTIVRQPRLWGMEDPHLYSATVSLRMDGVENSAVEDSATVRFGFREISTKDGQILLNGEPIFLLAALDQDIYPDTIYTVPSEEYLRDQFRKAKEMGMNCLRCHIKPPDPVYLDIADEVGMLIWTEIPSWRTFYLKGTLHEQQLNLSSSIKHRVEATLEEMIKRDYNHPSIIIWTLVNEDWGTTLPLSAEDRAWVAGLYDRCKALDPTRLAVDNSACPHPWGPNIHVRSDIDDFHIYANIPDGAQGFENTIEQFNLRPIWTYSSHGDAQRTGDEPLILSEFGNWGMSELRLLREGAAKERHNGGKNGKEAGSDPAWFNLGPWWNSWEGEAGWPAGVEDRFKQLGMDGIWPTYDDFARATQWHQFGAMKFEIEVMRRQPALSGYVITELADIYWETNGLLDFYRNKKAYHDVFSTINAPDMIIPQIHAYSYWDNTLPRARMHAAHYSGEDWSEATFRWSVMDGERGERSLAPLARGSVKSFGTQAFPLPAVEGGKAMPVKLEITNPAGKVLAANTLSLFVAPKAWREAVQQASIAVVVPESGEHQDTVEPFGRPPEGIDWVQPSPSADVAAADGGEEPSPLHLTHDLQRNIRLLGYHTTRHITPDTDIVITTFPNASLLKWVRDGGDMIALSNGPSPFFWVQSRSGAYSGNWLTSFSWLRPDVYKKAAAMGNPLGMPFRYVMPSRTILGLPLFDKAIHGDILSGMVSGWVGHPSAHTVQFRYGKGRVIMTTYQLEHAIPNDPAAVAMLHDLVDHVCSDAFEPVLKANW